MILVKMEVEKYYLTENCLKMPIDVLSKNGFFRYKKFICQLLFPNKNKQMIEIEVDTINKFIEFRYTAVEEGNNKKEQIRYRRDLCTTHCHFGGVRYWFLCICGRRVGVLYKRPYDRYFACRKCLNLTYYSTKLNRRATGYNYHLDYLDKKIDNLYKVIKLKYYDGRPTRKFRRLIGLEKKAEKTNMENYARFARKNF